MQRTLQWTPKLNTEWVVPPGGFPIFFQVLQYPTQVRNTLQHAENLCNTLQHILCTHRLPSSFKFCNGLFKSVTFPPPPSQQNTKSDTCVRGQLSERGWKCNQNRMVVGGSACVRSPCLRTQLISLPSSIFSPSSFLSSSFI